MRKDKRRIPRGLYCYGKNGNCPYWRIIKDRDEQENGWCDYIGKGDYEINRETGFYKVTSFNKGGEIKDEYVVQTGPDNPIFFSLLWDQCKECGINEDFEDFE